MCQSRRRVSRSHPLILTLEPVLLTVFLTGTSARMIRRSNGRRRATPPIILVHVANPIAELLFPFTFDMRRLLKSKSPVDIPTPARTPTPPAKLVKDLGSRRDSRALAATSSAFALSLGSALYDPGETSSDGATIRGKDTSWQTAYGAARMAVEIAKESSDMFPPLKAVVGAVSILIKNYDVSVPFLNRTSPHLILVSHSSKHRITWRV